MVSECFGTRSEQQRVMEMFREGRSKAEIGREIGKDKKTVGKMLAQAIRGMVRTGSDTEAVGHG